MSLFENFPYTNLHELNLDWLIHLVQQTVENAVISVNGQTGEVVLYQNPTVSFPNINVQEWSIVRSADGTNRGIYFASNGIGYIISGNLMNQIYSANNPPPYPVTSVNGQTGNITLYTDQNVQLPPLTDEQMTDWNIYRHLNNVVRGIKFDDEGKAYIIDGSNRYMLYSTNDTPPYPVTAVNGETGNIRLWFEQNNEIEFVGIDPSDPTEYTSWLLSRPLNDTDETVVGIEMTKTGLLKLHVGSTVYDIYSNNNPQPDWVDDPEANILNVKEDATGTVWGFIRDTAEGSVGIVFDNDSSLTEPWAELRYVDSNNIVHNVKLLTLADIPSSSGVVSVNGLTGVVVLTGTDLDMSSTDNRTIPAALEDLEEVSAFVETGNTASRNISNGSFVIWNHALYTAIQPIASGDTLSSTNLQSVTVGGFNRLKNNVDTLNSKIEQKNVLIKTDTISANGEITGIDCTGYRYVLVEFIGNSTSYRSFLFPVTTHNVSQVANIDATSSIYIHLTFRLSFNDKKMNIDSFSTGTWPSCTLNVYGVE